ncbi:hypothetical protein ACP4OV_023793 [Aristida adscensionis]
MAKATSRQLHHRPQLRSPPVWEARNLGLCWMGNAAEVRNSTGSGEQVPFFKQ